MGEGIEKTLDLSVEKELKFKETSPEEFIAHISG